ncbi:MAG TPA: DUF2330 domain-containing protein, partial [Polyangiales bacterium]
MLSARVLGLMASTGMAFATWAACSGQARAFGGLWPSQPQAPQQTAQQVLFVDPPGPSVTAIIRLQTGGPAQELAWLVPVPSKPTLALSSNAVFHRLDTVTSPQYWVEVGIEGRCSQPEPVATGYDPDYVPGAIDAPPAGQLALLDQGSLGSYEYATLEVDAAASDPAQVAIDWLAQNGFRARGMERELLGPYLRQGYNLLAFKLRSGADRTSLRPVALTYEGKQPVLPIRAASAASPAEMGVLVWVVGPAQAVPENFASLVLNDALVDWLSGRKFAANTLPSGGSGPFGAPVPKPRNYDALVARAVEEAGGRGFVTELGAPASRYRELVWSARDQDNLDLLTGQSFEDGLDLVLMAQAYFGGWDGFREAVIAAVTLPPGVTLEAFGAKPDQYRGAAKVDTEIFAKQLNEKVAKPVAEAAALMHQGPYLTRLYSVMRGAPTLDPSFNYNADLSQLHNVHVAQQRLECGADMPAQRDAKWRFELPQGAVVHGSGNQAWPLAPGALPANLKVVTLSSSGPGDVMIDNTQTIGSGLRGAGHDTSAGSAPQTPRHGDTIGGPQSVRPVGAFTEPEPTADAGSSQDDEGDAEDPGRSMSDGGCALGQGRAPGAGLSWLLLAALPAATRLRRRP